MRIGGEAYNLVEALSSTETSRTSADDEDVNVAAKEVEDQNQAHD